MTRRIPALTPDALNQAQRTLYDAIAGGPRAQGPQHFALTAADGSLRGPFDLMLRSPAVGAAQQELGAAIRYRTGFTARARELAVLLVAARWDSAFERDSHEAIARATGFSDADLVAIRQEDTAVFTGAEGVVGRTVVALLDGDLGDEGWREASSALGVEGIYELTALVGYYSTLALQMRVFRVT